MRRVFSKKNRLLIIWTVALIIIVPIFFLGVSQDEKSSQNNIHNQLASSTQEDFSAQLSTIEAKSYYVYDMVTGKPLFAKNEHDQLPLASLTKLMTSSVIAEWMPANTTIRIMPLDVLKRYDVGDLGLLWGEQWTRDDLLNYSLMTSSNDGMQALARVLDSSFGSGSTTTVALMNDEAKELGLTDSIFLNVSGLDMSTTTAGAYGSAHDIALLLAHLFVQDSSFLTDTTYISKTFTTESGIVHHAVNTDALIPGIPALLASKTGYTDLAGGNLVIAFDAGLAHPIIIAVLGSTEKGRFDDVATLVNVTLKKLSE